MMPIGFAFHSKAQVCRNKILRRISQGLPWPRGGKWAGPLFCGRRAAESGPGWDAAVQPQDTRLAFGVEALLGLLARQNNDLCPGDYGDICTMTTLSVPFLTKSLSRGAVGGMKALQFSPSGD